jgi:2-C-methyl-D-erythritol 4-phosphate cytidylyltransferase
MLTYAILPAAGRGVRLGMDRPKQFLELQDKPLLLHTLETIAQVSFLAGIVLVVPEDFLVHAQTLVTQHCGPVPLQSGTDSRWRTSTGIRGPAQEHLECGPADRRRDCRDTGY